VPEAPGCLLQTRRVAVRYARRAVTRPGASRGLSFTMCAMTAKRIPPEKENSSQASRRPCQICKAQDCSLISRLSMSERYTSVSTSLPIRDARIVYACASPPTYDNQHCPVAFSSGYESSPWIWRPLRPPRHSHPRQAEKELKLHRSNL
jgi:hypothetical protein